MLGKALLVKGTINFILFVSIYSITNCKEFEWDKKDNEVTNPVIVRIKLIGIINEFAIIFNVRYTILVAAERRSLTFNFF